MRPVVPPLVVALACRAKKGLSIAKQAAILHLTERQFYRMLKKAPLKDWWAAWKVGDAEKWCAACGFEFWNLKGTILQDVEWKPSVGRSGHSSQSDALGMVLEQVDMLQGGKPKTVTPERIEDLAERLNNSATPEYVRTIRRNGE